MAKTPKKPAKPVKKQTGKKSGPADAFIEGIKAQMGRPIKLIEDDRLVNQIKLLAAAQNTREQAAAILGVSDKTFREFLRKNPRSDEAWNSGPDYGKASLRMMQLATARKGNVRMQIWLGINWLGQTNRVDARHTGANGGPIQSLTTDMTPAQAAEAWQKVMSNGPG